MAHLSVISALGAFGEAYASWCKPLCREMGMPQMALDILMFLWDNPGYCTAKDISRIQGRNENIISVNVQKLVSEGYLERQSVEGDRRKVRLQCTEKAIPIIEKGHTYQARFIEEMHRGLTEEELQIHTHCLEVIAENTRSVLQQSRQGKTEGAESLCPK